MDPSPKANSDKPFFLYFSFYSVHTPLQTKDAYRNKYQKKINDMPFDLVDVNLYTFLVLDPEQGQDSEREGDFSG